MLTPEESALLIDLNKFLQEETPSKGLAQWFCLLATKLPRNEFAARFLSTLQDQLDLDLLTEGAYSVRLPSILQPHADFLELPIFGKNRVFVFYARDFRNLREQIAWANAWLKDLNSKVLDQVNQAADAYYQHRQKLALFGIEKNRSLLPGATYTPYTTKPTLTLEFDDFYEI